MTSLRQRTSEMLAYESNPSREEWRKLVTELLAEIDRLAPVPGPIIETITLYTETIV